MYAYGPDGHVWELFYTFCGVPQYKGPDPARNAIPKGFSYWGGYHANPESVGIAGDHIRNCKPSLLVPGMVASTEVASRLVPLFDAYNARRQGSKCGKCDCGYVLGFLGGMMIPCPECASDGAPF